MHNAKYITVSDIVKKLYTASLSARAHWMLKYHVSIVAELSEELTKKYGGNPDFSVAGAWLHDLADVSTERSEPNHETISLEKAENVLSEAGYTKEEIHTVIHEVLMPHSCYPGNFPKIIEGKILSTSDALGHITTDFYAQLCWQHRPGGKTYEGFRAWVTEKIERDFNSKIFFDDEKQKVREKYQAIKLIFSNNI